jgi:hypothetical protein
VPAVPDLDLARIRQFCDRRVPPHLRDEVRVEADVRGKSVTIFDCRPPWHPNLTEVDVPSSGVEAGSIHH